MTATPVTCHQSVKVVTEGDFDPAKRLWDGGHGCLVVLLLRLAEEPNGSQDVLQIIPVVDCRICGVSILMGIQADHSKESMADSDNRKSQGKGRHSELPRDSELQSYVPFVKFETVCYTQ